MVIDVFAMSAARRAGEPGALARPAGPQGKGSRSHRGAGALHRLERVLEAADVIQDALDVRVIVEPLAGELRLRDLELLAEGMEPLLKDGVDGRRLQAPGRFEGALDNRELVVDVLVEVPPRRPGS